ncbi:NTP transferase domain-containing protein [Sphingomonas sp. AP4-R1]|uniref:NTP transferase domain-containing protein n=1 Tax=Sphingomonas sp. AP4-R1 TaxID=2735134 RepID=UPI0014939ABB|nr:NTP transferase domain-containing protein [Sphingomonas sp. AP4-R1]QJU57261.1 NTP transferase domain-containing protein [Sphingomonas sp. AP4-R1]
MIYILLGAGSGTRMGVLTSNRAKILVDVDGRAILDHNLGNIATVDPQARVRIVTGYGAGAVADFVAARQGGPVTETVTNPDHAVAGPLRSIEIGLEGLEDAGGVVTIGNGDTIFQPQALAALAASHSEIALLASPIGAGGDADDVQLQLDEQGIRVAAKHLAAVDALPVSAGLLQIRGSAALARVREVVRAGIEREKAEQRMLTWHSIIAGLADVPPQAVMVPRESWWEFDSQESIDRYRLWLDGAAGQAD